MGLAVLPLNQSQSIPEIQLNENSIVQPTTYYTCPANKKAIAKIMINCVDTGAAAKAHLRDPTDSFNVAEWGVGVNSTIDKYDNLVEGQTVPIYLELHANDVIKTTQSTGTNAQFKIWGNILELPA